MKKKNRDLLVKSFIAENRLFFFRFFPLCFGCFTSLLITYIYIIHFISLLANLSPFHLYFTYAFNQTLPSLTITESQSQL